MTYKVRRTGRVFDLGATPVELSSTSYVQYHEGPYQDESLYRQLAPGTVLSGVVWMRTRFGSAVVFARPVFNNFRVRRTSYASLLSSAVYPATRPGPPANLLPAAASDFDTAVGWDAMSGAGLFTINTAQSQIEFNTNGAVAIARHYLPTPMTIGRQYGILTAIKSISGGAMQTGANTPGTQVAVGTGMTSVGYYTRTVTPTAAYAGVHLHGNNTAAFAADFLRVYDMTAMLAKKWRIVFVYSQSNWLGTEEAPDRLLNDRPEPRAVYIPPQANNQRGASLDANSIGVPMLLSDPLVHQTLSNGGPAGAFAREFCNGLEDDELLVYVATGYGGGGRIDPTAVWNRQQNGVAWAKMIQQVDGTLAKAPAGSTVAGCLFCQGEADMPVNVGDQHAQLIRDDFVFLRDRWGMFPIVMNEIGWDFSVNRPGLGNMIASHAKLDTRSGHALALPRVRYLSRPQGATFLPDTIHYDQRTQRVRGNLAARAMMNMHYGNQ